MLGLIVVGGQINPNGDKSNNNAVLASAAGVISSVNPSANGNGYEISITGADGTITDQKISKGLDVTAKPGQVVTKDSLLTTDPNVSGLVKLKRKSFYKTLIVLLVI